MHAICVETCAVARYARLPGMPGCPAVRLPGNMPGCPEICPVARKYVRLPGNMPGCPVCPAVRKYARLSGNMPGCPVCPAARKYARNVRLSDIGTTATVGRPTHSVSCAAGGIHRSAQTMARDQQRKSRPAHGPRQRRQLHAMLGRTLIYIKSGS